MASAEEPGEVLINFTDKQLGNATTVYSVHTTVCSAATTAATGADRTALPELPAVSKKAGGYIQIMFRSDGADTVESEESALSLPILILNRATGKVEREHVITFNNATGFTSGGTVDVVCAADIPVHIAYWEVPDGKLAMLKPGAKFHCYMGDDTA